MRLVTALVVLMLALSACGGSTVAEPPAKQIDERGMRTDSEPLTSRFPAIGEPLDVRWQSGTLGDDRVPGPSSYWIDAVITLDPAAGDALRDEGDPKSDGTPANLSAELTQDIAALVPAGTLTRSDALDAALATDGWTVDAWLIEGEDVLVVSAVGQ